MADTEDYFPRGGKKPQITHFKQTSNFLGVPEKSERKKKKPKKKSEGDDGYLSDDGANELYRFKREHIISLSYKTIKPGLLILGRVQCVMETKVTMMLPGRMIGNIMACHISEPYNKMLEAYVNDKIEKVRDLAHMFRPGQYVALKVMEAEDNHVMLSTMPQHINSGKRHSDLHKGAIFQAAVSSVEDHGYVMDIGISNTRAFLPKNEANPEIELDTGMVAWCTVKSVSASSESSIVTLASTLPSLQQAMLRRKPDTPLLPGNAVQFTVDTPLDQGIKGQIFGETTAYILRQHVDKVNGKRPALGQRVTARVLYVMPTSNTPFLTMKNFFDITYPDINEEQKLKNGDIVEDAQVLKITGRAINFKLGPDCLGTMSLRRVQVDEDLTDEEVVAKSYPIGSSHNVRVLCYNMSDYMYSVSDEPGLLNEKYFNLEYLKVGQLVDATVHSVVEGQVLLTIGRVKGRVPQSHLSDAGLYVDPKKGTTSKLAKNKYKVGQAVRARVLSVDPVKHTLFLTLKPSLLAPDLEILQNYEDAAIGKGYIGTIKYIRDFVLVSFFNNLVAFVSRQYVTKEPLDNVMDAFHVGQIVTCTIIRVDLEAKKMWGSLTTTPFWPSKKRERGEKRKIDADNSSINHKKQKTDNRKQESNDETEVNETREIKKKRKRDKKIQEEIDSENVIDAIEETEVSDTKEVRKKKKRDKKSQEEVESENGNDIKIKKKKKKTTEEDTNDTVVEYAKTKKKNKKKQMVQERTEENVESDAIETDFNEDSDQLLTPEEMALVDLSDCVSGKKYKKRVVALLKGIHNRQSQIHIIDKKISNIEEKGLDAKNKKFHTAMHSQKLIIEEIIQKLSEALDTAQEKLKELGLEEVKESKSKKGISREIRVENAEEKEKDVQNIKKKVKENKKNVKEKKEDTKVKIELEQKDVKNGLKKIQMVNSLIPALEVPSAKEFWSTTAESISKNVVEDSSSSSDDEQTDQPKKKRKKLTVAEKLSKAREEEERVRELERRAIESESQPRSSEQFERAVLANPDCSQLWIAYMAFHLQATEIEKARAVAKKALSTISFREEQEKLNVWLALINVETRFGTKETQQKAVEEALQMNDTFKVHSKLLDIYVETGKHQELSSLVDLMLRKYKRDPKTYIACGGACFSLALVEKARHVMQKAIAVLEKKEHVSVLVQFALLERSHGNVERAEALFEQVLAVYPQRVDVCSTYIDMLCKIADIDRIRQVMERMTSHKLPARKMKILYKKWIEVEEKMGDEEHIEKIRQRALDYVEKAKF